MNTPTVNETGGARRLTAGRWTVLLLFAVVLAGCASGKHSYYISPRLTGRVVAADTRQPLARATVRLVMPMMTAGEDTPPKGGQLLMQPGGALTGTDGRFFIEAQRVVAVLRSAGWYSTAVSIKCSGYENMQTNFSAAHFKTRTSEGVPWVDAGDVLLQPKPR